MIWIGLSAVALGAWLYLFLLHGRFWRADQRLPPLAEPRQWPPVVAVVPARDEAEVVAGVLESLLEQGYPGPFEVVLIDDDSSDGTGDVARNIAREIARRHSRGASLSVVAAAPRPPGWVGKMWAVATGVEHAEGAGAGAPVYWWLTDADIEHPRDHLRRLVAGAEAGDRVLVSQMVLLDHRGFWPTLLIPAFVYFFQQLYPFARVNRARSRVAAAAGGCMLVRADALRAVGGIEVIRGEVIDDCALARRLKREGPIWLGLSDTARASVPIPAWPASGAWSRAVPTPSCDARPCCSPQPWSRCWSST